MASDSHCPLPITLLSVRIGRSFFILSVRMLLVELVTMAQLAQAVVAALLALVVAAVHAVVMLARMLLPQMMVLLLLVVKSKVVAAVAEAEEAEAEVVHWVKASTKQKSRIWTLTPRGYAPTSSWMGVPTLVMAFHPLLMVPRCHWSHWPPLSV